MINRISQIAEFLCEKEINCIVLKQHNLIQYILGNKKILLDSDPILLVYSDGLFDCLSYLQFLYHIKNNKNVFNNKITSIGYLGTELSYQDYLWLSKMEVTVFIDVECEVKRLLSIKSELDLFMLRCCALLTERVLENTVDHTYRSNHIKEIENVYHEISGRIGFPDSKICITQISQSLLSMDCSLHFYGYYSDITRLVQIGEISQGIDKYYEFLLKVHDTTVHSIYEGMHIKDLFIKLNRKFLTDPLFRQIMNGFGHGIGYDIHENYSLYSRDNWRFQEGMTFTIEPILKCEYGDLRIENMYALRNNKIERINNHLSNAIYQVDINKEFAKEQKYCLNSDLLAFQSSDVNCVVNTNLDSLSKGKQSLFYLNEVGMEQLNRLYSSKAELCNAEKNSDETKFFDFLVEHDILI
jgi:Xaa-Pro aminopeptidase